MRVPREQRRSGHAGHDGKVLTATISQATLHIPLYPKCWTGKLTAAAEILYAIAGCCARAASGHAATAPPSAASNSRRPMVTVIRPSRQGA